MSTAEQQPLLQTSDRDVELGHVEEMEGGKSAEQSWRVWTAEHLESRPVHWFLLSLITIDSLLVIADLAYTLLSTTCPPSEDARPYFFEIAEYASIGISSLFLLEIPISLWALGIAYYDPWHGVPHAGLHVIDALVIVGTFILEVVLRGRERELAGLFILLRFWRIVKLVGGVAVGVGEVDEESAKKLAEANAEMKDKDSIIAQLHSQITDLKARVGDGS